MRAHLGLQRKHIQLVVALGVLGILAGASVAYACTFQAEIKVDPPRARAGATVTVTGTNFDGSVDRGKIYVHWNSTEGNVVWTGDATPNGWGGYGEVVATWKGSFQVPNVEPGLYTVVATQPRPSGGEWSARAQFEVQGDVVEQPAVGAAPDEDSGDPSQDGDPDSGSEPVGGPQQGGGTGAQPDSASGSAPYRGPTYGTHRVGRIAGRAGSSGSYTGGYGVRSYRNSGTGLVTATGPASKDRAQTGAQKQSLPTHFFAGSLPGSGLVPRKGVARQELKPSGAVAQDLFAGFESSRSSALGRRLPAGLAQETGPSALTSGVRLLGGGLVLMMATFFGLEVRRRRAYAWGLGGR